MSSNSLHSHHPKKHHLGRRIYGLLIVFAALAILFIFAIFFNQKVSQREKLAGSLPADHSVAFLEFNFDPSRSDTKELQNLARQNPLTQGVVDFFSASIPFPAQFSQWYGNRGGIALLQNQNGHGMSMALFLQVTNHDQAMNWLNQLALDPKNDALMDQDYLGQKLVSFRGGQTFNFLLSGDFMVISESIDNLKMIADTVYGNRQSLRNRVDYNKLISALPDQNPFFLFLDRSKLLDELSRSELFLAGHLAAYKLYFPFLNIISTEGIAINLSHTSNQKAQLTAQHLALFNTSTLPTPDFFATDYFYSGDLEKYLPPDTIFSAGGVNLLDQKNKLQAYFKNRSSIYELFFSGLLSQLNNNIQNPGSNLDLDQDLFPLFQKQYLFFAKAPMNGGKMPSLGLILESSSPDGDTLKMEKVLLAIGNKIASQIDAKSSSFTLPDGTPGKELVANLTAPQKQTISLAGRNAEQIQFSSDVSLYLVADPQNQHLLISNSSDLLSQMLAPSAQPSQPSQPDYSLPKPTETYRFNVQPLAQFWPAAAALKPLQSITIARKFTEIGILSTYQLGF